MIKLLSLFSGIGAFEKALDYLNVPYELVNYCEIDKYASKSYSLIHKVSEDKNLGDVTKVDTSKLPKDIDLITYGFPCQDISLAGQQKGFEHEGELTRSGLFFEALRIIEDTKPKIAIAENVKNLVSKKFVNEFGIVLSSLDNAGYNNYYKVLNAKHYGIPQNRERVFIVSIRKDIDDGSFQFPQPFELTLRLKDMLEDNVDEKYFLTGAMVERLFATTYESGKFENRVTDENGVIGTLCARDYKDPKCVLIKNKTKKGYLEATDGDGIDISGRMEYHRGTVQKGVSQTLSTMGGNDVGVVIKTLWTDTQVKMITPDGNVKRYIDSDVVDKFEEGQAADISFPNGYGKGNRVFNECPAINGTTTASHFITKISQTPLRIRKLTPKECFRLMGFEDDCVDVLIENGISNTQLYKMAGNSIVVDVLEEIFVELLNLKYIDLAA